MAVAVAVAVFEVNEKREPDEAPAVEDPNTIGAVLVGAAETEDAPKENPVDWDPVLNVEPKMEDFGGCQLDANKLEVAPPAPTELVSVEGAEELTPKLVLEPNTFEGVEEPNRELLEVEEPNTELLDVKDVIPEVPKLGDELDEPN